MDKRFVIHIVSELVIIVGVIVFFLRRTANIINSVRTLEDANRTLAAKVQELEKKLARVDMIERTLVSMQAASAQSMMSCPIMPPIRTVVIPGPTPIPKKDEGVRIIPFDEQLGISDEDEYVNVEKSEKGPSDIEEEIAEELAELTK